MSKTNPTEKQHFVPQFYLKNFADQQDNLQALHTRDKRIGNPRAYQSFGYGRYFYAAETGVPDEISQHVEKWLSNIESRISHELPRIIKAIKEFQQIQDDDRYILGALMSMLWLRSPGMREQLNAMQTNITKQTTRFYAPEQIDSFARKTNTHFSQEEREKIIQMMESGDYDVRFNNAHHLKFMLESLGYGGPGFTNMFFGMNWKIYLACGNERFITTDSPVVEWWLPPQGFWGGSFLERNKYFALTPEVFFELTYPTRPRKATRKILFIKDDDLVKTFNMLLVGHAQESAYSGDRRLLESLLSSQKNAGPLERAYFERFEKPWRDYREKQARFQTSALE